ncbi:D-alanyl-D-alanine carboxypeptidase family protein [Jannaschia sp. LMIT008]|uniref:D-alanyl-D-alanine carboxypeptidase family protein n=1 Tax=Jannaschia maritima TaxID=3032585 RepID=UPI002811822F|nr:D-alanyl-D-alanine carboxypeptidase family protein [Jannaschia sp. LMIT008]
MIRLMRAIGVAALVVALMAGAVRAAPYAEFLMDARNGEVLRSRNADARLHPASLTKMMTLYIAFEAVGRGEITLDTPVRISAKAAATPYAIGFRQGSHVKLRYLLRAAAVRSSNDGATAIAEAISGSVEAFAGRMNRTARALGMTQSNFKNPHGLTQRGHLSTARDMSLLGRRLFYDYPQYYNLFSRRTTNIGHGTVRNTNRKVLAAYNGADGIKTGFTNAAGFNLVASAKRGNVRVIATVFGGTSSAARNKRIMQLFDMGFQRAKRGVAELRPALPAYGGAGGFGLLARSARPPMRPRTATASLSAAIDSTVGQLVTRSSSSGGQIYGIALPRQTSRYEADRLLLRTALQELEVLDTALRQVRPVSGGFQPAFVGLSQRDAQRACSRIQSRQVACDVVAGG